MLKWWSLNFKLCSLFNNLVCLTQSVKHFEGIIIRHSNAPCQILNCGFLFPHLTHWLSMARSVHTGLVPSECPSRLSVCIFSPCSLSLSSHWTFTIHANSGAGAEHSHLIGQLRLIPRSHWPLVTLCCWQKRITRCSLISLEEWFIHSSTDTARSLLYTCYQSHPA